VTVFCHLEGVNFGQLIFINSCKLDVHENSGAKTVNILNKFEG
jgi:hypothetical protein